MAIIIPYGDTNAHGSLGGSLSFRRRFGRVVLQKQPFPVQPNTPAQLAQRTAFKNASYDWYSYLAMSKRYFQDRAPTYGWTPKNLYIHASLTGILPVQTMVPLKQVLAAQIINTCGSGPTDNSYQFVAVRDSPFYNLSVGFIRDNENIYYPTGTALYECDRFYLSWTQTATIPFRYGIWIQWKNWDDSIHEGIVRFLESTGASGAKNMSADTSLWESPYPGALYATNNF